MSSEQKIIIERGESDKKVKELEEELERLKGEKETLETEKGNLESKLTLIAEREFANKKAQLGCNDPEIDSPEKLMAWEKGKRGTSKGSGSAGTVSLKGQIDKFGNVTSSNLGDWSKRKYEDSKEGFKEMVSDLRTIMNGSEDPQERAKAKAILDELLIKSVLKGSNSGEREMTLKKGKD